MDRIDTTAFAPPDLMSGGASMTPVPITTAAMARAHVRAVVLEQWNSPSRRATETAVIDLLLVVSELAANAVRHGGGLVGVEATPTPEGVRLAVHDNSDVVPAAAFGSGGLPPVHLGNGYGWPLIIRLARDITIERRPEGGKTISVLVPLQTMP
ncbi:ATP-binding protein [Streptomyces liliifuscus]